MGVLIVTKEFQNNQVMTIDLHEYSVIDAKQKLTVFVKTAPKHIREIVVIHGYNHGTFLRDMVRKEFKNNRVERKLISLNQGITTLVLKVN